MAGSCRRFTYDALRRRPPKPARIRGRFSDADFFFEEKEPETPQASAADKPKQPEEKTSLPVPEDLSQFADLWEDDDETPKASAQSEPASESETEQTKSESEQTKEESPDEG